MLVCLLLVEASIFIYHIRLLVGMFSPVLVFFHTSVHNLAVVQKEDGFVSFYNHTVSSDFFCCVLIIVLIFDSEYVNSLFKFLRTA